MLNELLLEMTHEKNRTYNDFLNERKLSAQLKDTSEIYIKEIDRLKSQLLFLENKLKESYSTLLNSKHESVVSNVQYNEPVSGEPLFESRYPEKRKKK